jgi:hypothetical protein
MGKPRIKILSNGVAAWKWYHMFGTLHGCCYDLQIAYGDIKAKRKIIEERLNR